MGETLFNDKCVKGAIDKKTKKVNYPLLTELPPEILTMERHLIYNF
jgi:hypothetical protein